MTITETITEALAIAGLAATVRAPRDVWTEAGAECVVSFAGNVRAVEAVLWGEALTSRLTAMGCYVESVNIECAAVRKVS